MFGLVGLSSIKEEVILKLNLVIGCLRQFKRDDKIVIKVTIHCVLVSDTKTID